VSQGGGPQDSPSDGWGTGAAGDPTSQARHAIEAAQSVDVDPGTQPGTTSQTGADIDPMGLLPGGGHDTGRMAMHMDGISGGDPGVGTGGVSGTGAQGGHVSRGADVPGSLRAYVRRYLRALEQQRAHGSEPSGSDTH
jgi:hypothetical protein